MVRMKKIAHRSPPSLSASVESSPSEHAPTSKLTAPSKRTRVKLSVATDSAPRSIRSKKKVKIPISTSTTSSSLSSPSSASSASFSTPSSSGSLPPALNTSAAPTRRQTLRSRSMGLMARVQAHRAKIRRVRFRRPKERDISREWAKAQDLKGLSPQKTVGLKPNMLKRVSWPHKRATSGLKRGPQL
ncbi:hypothetical protein AXF42_Ash004433 [Apostasia shenzhenica]|uniref:Uncharacterized protein n=1 Tax=Apostasia shenzhenica TaxID=1088818 RepID=A0A2I0A2W0_9ASPA|nr:hypothetical protein AXF42_Ash004433 [Apostasia shenzhenica]